MASLLERLLGHKPKSANQAKERLTMVLIHDRTDLNPDILEKMKDEMMQVISRYVEIDPAFVQISMEKDGREQRLIAEIPIKPLRRRRSN
jgi:cell division topological specificity factor